MKIQNQFRRYELKYLLSPAQYHAVVDAMKDHTRDDAYGKSTVCNLYYDTPDFRLIRRSLEKPVYKEKLRLRSYGVPGPEDTVFPELKKKYRGVVYKRREVMCLREALDFLRDPHPRSQIGEEIAYFLSFYRTLAPAMAISYEREAYFGTEDPNLRITFDTHILWRDHHLSLSDGIGGEPILTPGQVLMEVKTEHAIPLWLTGVMTQEDIRRTSFSKYGRAYLASQEQQQNRSYADQAGGFYYA